MRKRREMRNRRTRLTGVNGFIKIIADWIITNIVHTIIYSLNVV